ncbi:hypothetical protein [Fangia hongkongensis]|uniref:hypothetical protein n=1 Tax=Fangia hongkongensis TaxID=270495 RepID=UPI0003768E85|nr:hypothetical protein [Fangia hongkongensis]MBK2123861.1 hypothetical protein [Fangia hongkongensis]
MFKKKQRLKRMKKLLMVDLLKLQSKVIISLAKNLFSVPTSKTNICYDDLKSLDIDDDRLMLITKKLRLIYKGCLLVAVVIFMYCLWLLWSKLYWLSLLAFAATILSLAQAFKHHFWLYQIKQKRFGCSFKDWLLGLIHQREKKE